MKNLKLSKVIASSLVVTSVLALNPIGARAEWKQDSNGWWNTEGSLWSVGWKDIDHEWYYFGQDGYMKTGWIQDSNGKWYYLNSNGSMAYNTTIDGYTLGSDGAWIQNISQQSTSVETNLSNINPNATTISGVTGVNFNNITRIEFFDGSSTLFDIDKPVNVTDKEQINQFMKYLDNCDVEKIKIPDSTGSRINAAFFINDKYVMNITFDNPIEINTDYYNTTNDLSSEKIKELLKSYNLL